VRVDLNFQTRVGAGGERVALDEREIEFDALPLDVARATQTHLAAHETDAHHARVLLVFAFVNVFGGRGARGECECGREEENQE
jgi:hypothetical protein